jgi:hypothetical protein
MKNLLIGVLITSFAILAFAFKTAEQPGNAVTEKRSGLDVYVYCSPTKAYDVVSNEKFVVAMDCNEIFTKPVKKALGKGDAVIIYPELSKFDIIKYKP